MKNLPNKTVSFACLLLLILQFTFAQNNNSATLGKEFVFAFGSNSTIGKVAYLVKIASTKRTTIQITYADGTQMAPLTLEAYTIKEILLDPLKVNPNNPSSSKVLNTSVRITSSEAVAVYAMNQLYNSSEATAILPLQALDTTYQALAYKASGSVGLLVVVANEDNTAVQIEGNVSMTKTLQANEVLYYLSSLYGDLTSYTVHSSKPVAVFTTVDASKIPDTDGDADNLYEQIWSQNSWGKSFLVGITNRGKERVRVLAREDGTQIEYIKGTGLKGKVENNTLIPATFPIPLNAGEWAEFEIENSIEIRTNKASAVSSYLTGNKYSSKEGDPSMCWINPNEQMTSYTLISPFYCKTGSAVSNHRLIIVARNKFKHLTTLKVNKVAKYLNFINPPGVSDYAIAEYIMPNSDANIFEIENIYGFNAYIYGYGAEESYYLASGSSTWDLNAFFTIDTIFHDVTTPKTNSYSTSGKANLYREINYAYDTVLWHIKNASNSCDITHLVQDKNKLDTFFWQLPTSISAPNPYCLTIGENEILMIVKKENSNIYDTLIGKIWITPPPLPHPDYGYLFGNGKTGGGEKPAEVCIYVRENDEYINFSDSIFISNPPSSGEASLHLDTTICYTPDPEFNGVDTLEYCFKNLFGDIACEKNYILVVIPTAERYEACPNTTLSIGFEKITQDIQFNWYADSTSLTPIATNTPLVELTLISDTALYAEAIVNGVPFPLKKRIRVPVYLSTLCGKEADEACKGSSLFSEDFRGNDSTDAAIADSALSYSIDKNPNVTSLQLQFSQNNPPLKGEYSLVKQLSNLQTDHSFPSDKERGRMLLFHGEDTPLDTILHLEIGNLCDGITYSLSYWMKNLNNENIPGPILELVDTSTHIVLLRTHIDSLRENDVWKQYGFNYTTHKNLESIRIRLILPKGALIALDDLRLSICSPQVELLVNQNEFCLDEKISFSAKIDTLTALTSLNTSTLAYLWQYKPTQEEDWQNLSTTSDTAFSITKAALTHKGYYRVVAGNPSLLSNPFHPNCVLYSEPISLSVIKCFLLENDYSLTQKDSSVTIPVLENDLVPCSTPILSIKSGPKHGIATVSVNNHVTYKPNTLFTGIDSLEYNVLCGTENKKAWAYIAVVGLNAEHNIACPNAITQLNVEPLLNANVEWYNDSLGGNPIGNTNLLNLTAPNQDTKYFVEVVYNNIHFAPRLGVLLEISDNCGSATDKSCDGFLLFAEDFGGGNPDVSPIANSQDTSFRSDYSFSSLQSLTQNNFSQKKHLPYTENSLSSLLLDHTYPLDTTKGYLYHASLSSSKQLLYERSVKIDLCEDQDVFFSAWIFNPTSPLNSENPKITMLIKDFQNHVLAEFHLGEISKAEHWLQYGGNLKLNKDLKQFFIQIIATNLSSLNSEIALDDIQLKACSSEFVKLSCEDPDVCEKNPLQLHITYAQPNTASNDSLPRRWEKSATGNINNEKDWVLHSITNSDTLFIRATTLADAGFYRVVTSHLTDSGFVCQTPTDPMEVQIYALPLADISGSAEICAGDSCTIVLSTNGDIKWQHDHSNQNTLRIPLIEPTTFYATVSSNKGCSIQKTFSVQTLNAPQFTLIPDTIVCIGNEIRLFASSNETGLTYEWNDGSLGRFITVKPTFSQNYWIEAQNRIHCKTKKEVYVDVLPLPRLSVEGDSLVCKKDSIKLVASGALNYRWTNGTTSSTLTKEALSNTSYTVEGTDVFGCKSSKTIAVQIVDLPEIALDGKTSLCAGDTSTLTVSGGKEYQWSNGASGERIHLIATKDELLHVVAYGDHNCKARKEIPIHVYPIPDVRIQGESGVCLGNEMSLSIQSSSKDIITYQWSTGETTSTLKKTPTQAQIYGLSMIDSKGCKTYQEHYVDVYPLPILSIFGDSVICLGQELTLSATGAIEYLWNNEKRGSSFTDKPKQNTYYTLKGTNEQGCSSEKKFFVQVESIEKLTPEILPLIINRKNSTVNFHVSNSNLASLHWDLGDGNESTQSTFSHTYNLIDKEKKNQFLILLTYTNANGCADTLQRIVQIEPYIPNTFTPDGDGVNDLFLSECNCKNLQIFNRMGVRLYEGTGPWDGKYNNQVAPNDTYYYVITYHDGQVRKGFVTIAVNK